MNGHQRKHILACQILSQRPKMECTEITHAAQHKQQALQRTDISPDGAC